MQKILRYNQTKLNKYFINNIVCNQGFYPFKMFSSVNQDENFDEIIEDEQDKMNRRYSTREKYENEMKTYAIEVENPVFPLGRFVMPISENKYKLFMKRSLKTMTTVVRHPSVKQQINVENQDEPINVTDNYYKFGTYCNVEYSNRFPYSLILNGLYRVEYQSLIQRKIQLEEEMEDASLVQEGEVAVVEDQEQVQEADISIPKPPADDEPQTQQQSTTAIVSQKQLKKNRMDYIIRQLQKNRGLMNPNPEEQEEYVIVATSRMIYDPEYKFDIYIEARLKHIIDLYTKIIYINKSQVPQINYNLNDAQRIVDSLGGFLVTSRYFRTDELQIAFEQREIADRLEKVHSLMQKYFAFLQYFQDVGQLAQQNLNAKKQKEFYDEMFRIVKGVVEGEKGKNAVLEKIKRSMEGKKVPKHIQKIFDEEARRYSAMDESSQESNMIRTYLEWVASLPYGVQSEDNYNLREAKEILDSDHYGMEDVKDRILEFIAAGKLKGSLLGKIILLVGPPGTGKTSLSYSIARALNRKFARIAMGGESDSSFLKGHRKTYIGAYPGKIVSALKECGTENCVILLDEIDKLGRSDIHGDPQSNLLEILDPQQNNSFTDNFLDFPIDLSKVLFICSANIKDTIQAPLLDRMDVIQLSSYTNEEKRQIFYKHLYPKAVKEFKDTHMFKILNEVVDELVNNYCRDAGIRSLEKYTRRILEKIAYQIVVRGQQEQTEEIVVSCQNLPQFIGHPKYPKDKFYTTLPKGVVIGLAYTEYGGSIMYLEATQSSFVEQAIEHKENLQQVRSGLKTTGSLGGVMKESMQIAYTYAKAFLYDKLNNQFLEKNEVHIHAPEGAVPKDGPSAGIAITSALVSLALQTPIKQNVGMTGEISLRGKVLKIGGIKEKILASKREGLKEVIVPLSNKENVLDLPEYIREGIIYHYAENYEEVFNILFPNIHINSN